MSGLHNLLQRGDSVIDGRHASRRPTHGWHGRSWMPAWLVDKGEQAVLNVDNTLPLEPASSFWAFPATYALERTTCQHGGWESDALYVMLRSVPAGSADGEGGEAASVEREAALEALLAALKARDAAAERLQLARSVMAAPLSC